MPDVRLKMLVSARMYADFIEKFMAAGAKIVVKDMT